MKCTHLRLLRLSVAVVSFFLGSVFVQADSTESGLSSETPEQLVLRLLPISDNVEKLREYIAVLSDKSSAFRFTVDCLVNLYDKDFYRLVFGVHYPQALHDYQVFVYGVCDLIDERNYFVPYYNEIEDKCLIDANQLRLSSNETLDLLTDGLQSERVLEITQKLRSEIDLFLINLIENGEPADLQQFTEQIVHYISLIMMGRAIEMIDIDQIVI